MDFGLLSKYDDLLCDIFLDDLFLWFKTIKMNANHRKANIPSSLILDAIKRHVVDNGKPIDAVAELLKLDFFQSYLNGRPEKERYEFGQHMKRYLYMYMPNAGYEISDTSRYGTGSVEACVVATKDWKAGDQLRLCVGQIACLDAKDDAELKRSNRDFSVMYSTRKGCSCLFLGPARFMNHDCDSNCKFISLGQNAITFKIVKDIPCGEEMTVFYGMHYFGENNCECRCATCEQRQEGYFSPKASEDSSNVSFNDKENGNAAEKRRRSGRKRKQTSYDAFFLFPEKTKSRTTPSKDMVVFAQAASLAPLSISPPSLSKRSPVMNIDFLCHESNKVHTNEAPIPSLDLTTAPVRCANDSNEENCRAGGENNTLENDNGNDDVNGHSRCKDNMHQDYVNRNDDDTKNTNEEVLCPTILECIQERATDADNYLDDFMDDLSDLSSLSSFDLENMAVEIKRLEPDTTKNEATHTHCITCKRDLASISCRDTSEQCARCNRHFILFSIDWPVRKLRKPRKQRADGVTPDNLSTVTPTIGSTMDVGKTIIKRRSPSVHQKEESPDEDGTRLSTLHCAQGPPLRVDPAQSSYNEIIFDHIEFYDPEPPANSLIVSDPSSAPVTPCTFSFVHSTPSHFCK